MAKLGSKISNPDLWDKLEKEVRDQNIGGTEQGKLSSRKIEILEERYKKKGGTFSKPKKFVSKENQMANKISRQLEKMSSKTNKKITK